MKQTFIISQEYIELNGLLKRMNLAETGGHANQLIDQGKVMVNGKVEHRRRNKIRAGDLVSLGKNEIIVEANLGE
jgi:ribosome-associated protein